MKTSLRIFSVVLLLCVLVSCFSSCEIFGNDKSSTNGGSELPEWVDYASNLKYDPNSNRAKFEVTLQMHIDGDTTHFRIKDGTVGGSNILKARYLAVDTPESTGAIEKWGKKASNFTKEKLSNAISIIVESDTQTWNPDSTGSRYMVWVWYKTAEMTDYRCLNLEILQEGLAKPKGTDNTYGDICFDAYMQARSYKLHVFSNDPDPDYYLGDIIQVDLKELATNPEKYEGKTVAFEGTLARKYNNSAYIQSYDQETGMYHGIGAYYGYGFAGESLLQIGNKLLIVGSVQYWEGGGTYQISDLKYYSWDPDNKKCIKLLEENQEVVYTLTSPELFTTGKVSVIVTDEEGEEVLKEFSYADMALDTAIEMHDLYVSKVYTTVSTTDSNGEMTLTCTTSSGHEIIVRTAVLKDANGNRITEDYFKGKTIDVKGLVAYYNGNYQIRLISVNDVVVK